MLYWRAVEVLPLGVGADHQADGAVGVDVVRAVLGVVLDDEDRDLGPGLAVGDGLDDPAQGQVVAGHAGLGRERAGPGAGGVVLAQAHDHEPGQRAVLLELLELRMKVSALSVSRLRPARALRDAIIRAHVADQSRHGPFDRERAVGLADPPAVLAIAAIGEPRAGTGVPEIARRGVGQVAVLVVVDSGPRSSRSGPSCGRCSRCCRPSSTRDGRRPRRGRCSRGCRAARTPRPACDGWASRRGRTSPAPGRRCPGSGRRRPGRRSGSP